MADIYTYLDNNGIIVTDTADIKETVQGEFQTALGADLSLEDSTPQGRLIDIETDARSQVIENNALIANLFNFNMAFGVALDALGANYGLGRQAATSSSVVATVTGVEGTTISAGSQAATQAGDLFYAENNITIPASGSVNATFLSVEKGVIPCPVGSLTKIIDGTFGWETINNTSSAILGQEQESDASFKQKFYDSGLFNGMSLTQDYENALMNVANVQSCYVRDNGKNVSEVYDTVTINPHSVYACVDGGNDEDVAQALFNRKSGGSGWSGNTTVTITDETWGDTYEVTFDRPAEIQIYTNITVDVGTSTTPTPELSVQEAVNNYINGLKVGGDVLPFEVATAVTNNVSGVKVTNVQVGTSSGSLATSDITIHINQVAKSQLENITVTLNG